VLLEGSEVDQYPVKSKRWHPIADNLFGIGSLGFDRGSNLLENRLHIRRELAHVFLEIPGSQSFFHFYSITAFDVRITACPKFFSRRRPER